MLRRAQLLDSLQSLAESGTDRETIQLLRLSSKLCDGMEALTKDILRFICIKICDPVDISALALCSKVFMFLLQDSEPMWRQLVLLYGYKDAPVDSWKCCYVYNCHRLGFLDFSHVQPKERSSFWKTIKSLWSSYISKVANVAVLGLPGSGKTNLMLGFQTGMTMIDNTNTCYARYNQKAFRMIEVELNDRSARSGRFSRLDAIGKQNPIFCRCVEYSFSKLLLWILMIGTVLIFL